MSFSNKYKGADYHFVKPQGRCCNLPIFLKYNIYIYTKIVKIYD